MPHSLTLLYATLIIWFSGGLIVGKLLGERTTKFIYRYLERGLHWVGIPLLIISTLHDQGLNLGLLISPIMAWCAIGLSLIFALIWIENGLNQERIKSSTDGIHYIGSLDDKTILRAERETQGKSVKLCLTEWSKPSQGSIFATMMVGNTSYLGLLVVLSLAGANHIGGAVLYDLLGSTLGCYALGLVLARRFQNFKLRKNLPRHIGLGFLRHPFVWALILGLILGTLRLPPIVTRILENATTPVTALCLTVIGLQLSQITEIHKIPQAAIGTAIKMLVTPIVIGTVLTLLGITGSLRLAVVLQCAMPPGLVHLPLVREYRLDEELTNAFFVTGYLLFLVILPLWVKLFGA